MSYQVLPKSHFRSSLARVIYSKMLEDQYDSCHGHSNWYELNLNEIDGNLSHLFHQLYEDEETKKFLEACREKSDWIVTQLFHSFFKFIFSFFMTSTTVNGLLNRGSMFVMSSTQFKSFMNISDDKIFDNLLDMGAGDGAVTEKLSRHYRNIYVTEKSSTMVWRLKSRGYQVLDADSWYKESSVKFDTIACLNLLDRCDRPLDLLETIHSKLVAGTGRLLLAFVLPFSHYVEFGATKDHKPQQVLNIPRGTLEQQLSGLIHNVLVPAGYEVEKFSKVPYLCEGDLQHSYYVLQDVILLLKSVKHQ
ncbi:hypothetical protein HELRODRAFT_74006 [Helobdella robusta]|uniref:Methyltransferase-like protein 9 n=1 Tax=Helobdella robusta TaxID=6412 RepID=T1G1L0_HELRO|nr:hypothetical protein HELRODRAFT_74006 [Helobdella robusta]ESO09124.1 hypothetical protein HELRODRAFT_74006 [Helobdella robusta]